MYLKLCQLDPLHSISALFRYKSDFNPGREVSRTVKHKTRSVLHGKKVHGEVLLTHASKRPKKE